MILLQSILYLIVVFLTISNDCFAEDRKINWKSEIVEDSLLGLGALGIELYGPKKRSINDLSFPTQSFDDHMSNLIHGREHEPFVTNMERTYLILSDITVVTASSLTPAYGIMTSKSEEMLIKTAKFIKVLLLSNFIVTAMKYGFLRPRPKLWYGKIENYQGEDLLSFPSGHSAAAFAGASFFAKFYPHSPKWLKIGGFLLATLTAWARIGGGVHFFTDVVTGGAIGLLSSELVWLDYHYNDYPLSGKFFGNYITLNLKI